MKVYLLTSGIYSDYHVIGAFSSYKKAREASEKIVELDGPIYSPKIEEWEIDDIANGLFRWRVKYTQSDDRWDAYIDNDPENSIGEVWGWRACGSDMYGVYVRAIDRESALKNGSEMIMRTLAGNG